MVQFRTLHSGYQDPADNDLCLREGCSLAWLPPQQLRPWSPQSSPYRPPIPLWRFYPTLRRAQAHSQPCSTSRVALERAALSRSAEALTGLASQVVAPGHSVALPGATFSLRSKIGHLGSGCLTPWLSSWPQLTVAKVVAISVCEPLKLPILRGQVLVM